MKLYVLACKKLSKSQQYVQGAHAAIEWAMENNSVAHPILVMLKCPAIETWKALLEDKDIPHHTFHDSYYDGRLTAIASTEIGELAKKLELI